MGYPGTVFLQYIHVPFHLFQHSSCKKYLQLHPNVGLYANLSSRSDRHIGQVSIRGLLTMRLFVLQAFQSRP